MLFRKTENIDLVKLLAVQILLEVKEANLIGVFVILTMYQNIGITGKGQGNISLRWKTVMIIIDKLQIKGLVPVHSSWEKVEECLIFWLVPFIFAFTVYEMPLIDIP